MIDTDKLLEISNTLWDKSRDEYAMIFPDEDAYKDIFDYRQLHSKIVADLAIEMFDNYYESIFTTPPDNYKSSLYLACLLHDIKKLNKKHNKVGAKYVLSNKNLINDNYCDTNLIFTLINYHSADKKGTDLEYINEIKNLHDNIKLLVLFIRLSDKLSKPLIKSNYKKISPKDIDAILNKIKMNSKEILAFNIDLNSLIITIERSFKDKYCN